MSCKIQERGFSGAQIELYRGSPYGPAVFSAIAYVKLSPVQMERNKKKSKNMHPLTLNPQQIPRKAASGLPNVTSFHMSPPLPPRRSNEKSAIEKNVCTILPAGTSKRATSRSSNLANEGAMHVIRSINLFCIANFLSKGPVPPQKKVWMCINYTVGR